MSPRAATPGSSTSKTGHRSGWRSSLARWRPRARARLRLDLPGCAVTSSGHDRAAGGALHAAERRPKPATSAAGRAPARRCASPTKAAAGARAADILGYNNNTRSERDASRPMVVPLRRLAERRARIQPSPAHQGHHQPGRKFQSGRRRALLDSHPQILQSAIVPMPDPVLGEKACAFITVKPGCDAPHLQEVSTICSPCRSQTSAHACGIPEMPLTPTRKSSRKAAPEQAVSRFALVVTAMLAVYAYIASAPRHRAVSAAAIAVPFVRSGSCRVYWGTGAAARGHRQLVHRATICRCRVSFASSHHRTRPGDRHAGRGRHYDVPPPASGGARGSCSMVLAPRPRSAARRRARLHPGRRRHPYLGCAIVQISDLRRPTSGGVCAAASIFPPV